MTISNDDLIMQLVLCVTDEDEGVLSNKALLTIASRLASIGRISSENELLLKIIEGDDDKQEIKGSSRDT